MNRLGKDGFSCHPIKTERDAVFELIKHIKIQAEKDKKVYDKKIKRKTKSKYGYCGIYKHKNKWMSMFQIKYKKIYLGIFDTMEEASNKYKETLQKYYGMSENPIDEWNESWILEKVTQYFLVNRKPRLQSAWHDMDRSVDEILLNAR